MEAGLRVARREVASEIGADAGSFTPADEKRFTGVEIMIGIGGAMLYSFFKGMGAEMIEKAGEVAGEKAFDALAGFLRGRFEALSGQAGKEQDEELENAHRELKVQIQALTLTREQVQAIAAEVEPVLVAALARTAPPEVSRRIGRKVRLAALRTL